MRRRRPERPIPRLDISAEEPTVYIGMSRFRKARRSALWLKWRRLVWALLALVAAVAIGWLLWFSPYLTAERVEVAGTTTVSPARVRALAQVPLGRPLMRVELDAVRARVETIAAVREASVSRAWPHAVRIEIAERKPVAVVERDGNLQSLDSTGVLFGKYQTRPSDLPLVRTDPRVDTDALAEAGRVAASLPPDLAAKVAFIEVATVDEIRLQLNGGVRVQWGSAAQSTDKAEVVAALLKPGVKQIDVTVPGRPTTSG